MPLYRTRPLLAGYNKNNPVITTIFLYKYYLQTTIQLNWIVTIPTLLIEHWLFNWYLYFSGVI